jgi:hypothetical protein
VSGGNFAINNSSASTLEFTGTATIAPMTLGTNQTLEVGSTGNVTISGAETIGSGGTITLAGGTLTDSSGLTVNTGGTLTGFGTIAGSVASSGGTITASGGTLNVTGTVSGGTYTIGTSPGSILAFSSSATIAPITINNANQTLQVGNGANLTISGTESITNGTIVLAGGTLTDSSNLTIGSGATLSGYGTVAANIAAGSGTITATGGTLNLAGTVASGNAFTIGTSSASTLEFSSTAATGAITLNNANQTLLIGSSGNLTISSSETVSGGTLQLAGGKLTASSLTVSSGSLSGYGTVATATTLSGGTITQSGGTLTIPSITATGGTINGATVTGAITAGLTNTFLGSSTVTLSGTVSGALAINIDSGFFAGANTLVVSGTVTSTLPISLTNSTQALQLNSTGNLTINGAQTVAGGTVTMAGGTLTDTSGLSVTSGTFSGYGTVAANVTGSGGTIQATGGTLNLTGTVASGTTFTIGTASGSNLEFSNTAASAAAISISNANQALTVGSGGNLTIGAAESITNGKISLAGGTLTDSGNVTIGSGATLSGYGKVVANIAGSTGTITASGGVLNLAGTVTSGNTYTIGTATASTLEFTGTATIAPIGTFNSTNQTLEVGSGGNLTISAAQSVTNGTIQLAGGTLTDTLGLTVGSGATLTSSGTSTLATGTAAISNVGTLSVTGGTLSLTGTGTLTDTGNVTIASGATLSSAAAINNSTGTISLSGGTLSGAGALTNGGTLTGFGTVGSNVTGSGTVTANGGTLNLTGTVASGNTFTIGSATSSTLEFSGTATAASPIAISSATQTLQIGSGGHLTINAAESITNGTISLAGGTLTDSSGLTIGAGANLAGSGLISAPVNGSGTITATGGVLEIAGSADATTSSNFQIAAGATLKFDASVGAGLVAPVVTFQSGTSGTLDLTGTSLSAFNASISGFGSGDRLDVTGAASTWLNPAGNLLTVYNSVGASIGTINLGSGSNYVGDLFSVSGGVITEAADPITPVVSTVVDSSNSPNVTAGTPLTITLTFNEKVIAAAGTTLTLSDGDTATIAAGQAGTPSSTLTFTYTPSANSTGVTVTGVGSGSLTDAAGDPVTGFGETICFMPGTRIATPHGNVAVETLKVGDLVTTADGHTAPVRWVGRQTISRIFADPMRALPIRIRAGALGENLPARDLLISPDHAILVEGVLVQAGALVNGTSIRRESDVPSTFVYYHVELDDHSLILAEGVAAETFIDNVGRMGFDNWKEHEALYPERRIMSALPHPRVMARRQVPQRVRLRVAERTAAMTGGSEASAA